MASKKMFEELAESVREGVKILRNEIQPSRRFEINFNEIKEIRLKKQRRDVPPLSFYKSDSCN